MTTTFTWNELKKLVVIDHEIGELKKSLKKAEGTLSSAQSAYKKEVEQQKNIELAARAIQKEIDRYELDSKDLREQATKKREKLKQALSPKESAALEHELHTLQCTIDRLETQLMTLLEQQEVIQKTIQSHTQHLTRITTDLAALQSQTALNEQKVQEQLGALTKAWDEQLPLVPLELCTNYLNLRSRIPNAVVPVVSNSCSGCYIELLAQDMHSLSTRTVMQCRGCFRFLFIPDATTVQLPATAL